MNTQQKLDYGLMRGKIKKARLATGGQNKLAFWLISPLLLYLLVVMVLPVLWAIYMSFTDKMIGTKGSFTGLENYINLMKDPVFWKSVTNTLIFTISAIVLKVVFGIIMALVLNENLRFRNVIRVLLFLPWTIPTIVSVFTWQWLYSDMGGVFNYILSSIGIIERPLGWLSDPNLAMVSVILVNVWRGIPFFGIAILAGLQTISSDMYEAAMLDGANAIKRFFYITLPSIKEVTIVTMLISTVWTLNDFEIVWLLTRGGPSNGTLLLSTYSYIDGFLNLNIGRALAISIITLPPLIWLINTVTKKMVSSN